ncbi:MAG TPA: glycosyltransferase [Aliidongia sp.]|nr:glycosyltransferase [Aliidongia sp.]
MTRAAPRVSPRVSVVMPIYNGAAFLAESIETVLAQTMADFELILVDDGSTDETARIIAAYAARDRRIVALAKANSGISDTLNQGLAVARADWIARLDSDDLMLPERLERQLAFVEANPDVIAAGSYYEIIDAAGRNRGSRMPLPRTREELAGFLAAREPLSFLHPSMIYRRRAALELGGYEKQTEPAEDVALFARMLATGAPILIQPEILLRYRVHANAVSSRNATRQFMSVCWTYHNFYAARDGKPPLTYEAYMEHIRRRPLGERLALRLRLLSDGLYRRSATALVGGRRASALAYLAAASALRPAKAIRRALRSLTPTGAASSRS